MKSVDPGILSNSICFSFIPSNLAKKLYFYPTWCGHYFCTDYYYMKRDFFPDLLIVFVRKGFFHFEYRGLSFDAQKGDVVLLDCQEPHYYHARNGLEFLYMHFGGSNAREICHYILKEKGSLIRQDSNVLIGNLLYNMVDFYAHDNVETMFQSSMRIYHLFEHLLTSDHQALQNDDPIDTAIRYIRSNVGKEISLDNLAENANLSPFYFAHKFKHQTGFSPREYVINIRLEKAKILLAHSSKTVAEIAYEIGYSSSSSLINIFTKREGISPKQYRKTIQGQ